MPGPETGSTQRYPFSKHFIISRKKSYYANINAFRTYTTFFSQISKSHFNVLLNLLCKLYMGTKENYTHMIHNFYFLKKFVKPQFLYINNDEGTLVKYSSVWEWPIFEYTSITSNVCTVHIIFLLTMVKTISINSQSVVSEWWVLEPHLHLTV